MNIKDAHITGGAHVVILGAGASIASSMRDKDANGLSLPSMKNLPDIVGLNGLLSMFPQDLIVPDDFEATYSNLAEKLPGDSKLKTMNDMIYSYFSSLRLPEKPTIYDYLIMSLREKDIIATFNWDPYLYQAWWRNFYHGSSPHLVFLHGNVAIGYNEEHSMFGWAGSTSPRTGNYYKPTQLLYPVKHKDYNQDFFIRSQWETLKDVLDKNKWNTHYVTVFGYSAPVSDAEALEMMKSAWGDIATRNMEQLEFIDIREEEDVVHSWREFVHTHHYHYRKSFFESSLAMYPRRTDESYFCHFLPCTPEEACVKPNPVPQNFETFDNFWNWYEPLIQAERQQ